MNQLHSPLEHSRDRKKRDPEKKLEDKPAIASSSQTMTLNSYFLPIYCKYDRFL